MSRPLTFASLALFVVAACAPAASPRSQIAQPAPRPADPTPSSTASGGAEPQAAADASSPPSGAAECATDADCVRASCCHATQCVPRSRGPGVCNAMCTMDCQPNTLDCGGSCACEHGTCATHFGSPVPGLR